MQVTRRAFGASMAAAFGSMALGRTASPKQSIDLTPFLDDCDGRYPLSKPFSINGRVYATNAQILCRVAGVGITDKSDIKLPDVERLPWDAFFLARFRPLPSRHYLETTGLTDSRCIRCQGLGRVGPNARWCTACDDYGAAEDMTTCKVCKGEMKVGDPCDFCDDGWITLTQYLGDGIHLAPEMDQKIRTLPNVEYALSEVKVNREKPDPLVLFRGPGYQGMVLPQLPKSK